MTQEKRKNTRIPFTEFMEIVCLRDDEQSDIKISQCQARDVSAGGISFYSATNFPVNSLLRLRIPLNKMVKEEKIADANDNILKVMGKVVWSKATNAEKQYVTGVHFLNIYDQDFDRLHDYVRDNLASWGSFKNNLVF